MKNNLIQFAASKVDKVGKEGEDYGVKVKSLDQTVVGIINAVIGVLGLVAVIVIIVGGVQYMTSSGDSGKVKKAKDTILYGVIGLIICALAFAIVNFVISNIISGDSEQALLLVNNFI